MSLHTHCDVPGCTATAPLAGLSFAYEEINLAEGWKNGTGEVEHICPAHPVRIADGEWLYAEVGEDLQAYGVVRGFGCGRYRFVDPVPEYDTEHTFSLPLSAMKTTDETKWVLLEKV